MQSENRSSVLVTGSDGYLGRQLMEALAREREGFENIVAMDVRDTPQQERQAGIQYLTADIRSPELANLFGQFHIDNVVHLASIVTPGKKPDREFQYSVDVLGTQNVLEACINASVNKLIITSSGAAYGYHPDNPAWFDEGHALRGNPEFAYSDHKRLVEEMLARYREEHPELKQLIFRPGTILGERANNQITALFEKPVIIGLMGVDAPFVLIWDKDVIGCIMKGLREDLTGIYNLAGDGIITMREMALMLGKPYLPLPVWLVKVSLWVLKKFGLTHYGPEQIGFLRYRPVLSNRRLKEEFGYVPEKTTRQTFEYFLTRNSSP
jgi:UDP-glucose 4-epimerase